MNIYFLYSIIASMVCFCLAGLVYSIGRRNHIKRSFALVTGLIGFWSLFPFLSSLPYSDPQALFFVRTIYIAAVFVPSFYLKFMLDLIGERGKEKGDPILKASYFFASLFALFVFNPVFIKGVLRFKPYFAVEPGALYLGFIIYFAFMYFYAAFKLMIKYRSSFGYSRMQLKYVGFAFLIAFVSGVIHFLSAFGVREVFPHDVLVALYTILIAYAIAKYRLMDITTLAIRTFILLLVYGVILVGPLFTFFASESIANRMAIGIYALLASSAPFIYIYLRSRTENIIFKEQRRYQEALTNLSKSMIDIREIEGLFRTITSTITDTVKVKFAAIYLEEKEYKSFQLKSCYPSVLQAGFKEFVPAEHPLINILLRQEKPLLSEELSPQDMINPEMALVIPCFGKEGLLGFIMLGAKQNNQIFSSDDLLVFENLSYATSLAIENCYFWKEIEDRHRKARLQEMDTYSYSLAHEIDNPIQVVIGQTDFLKEYLLKYITDEKEKKEAEDAVFFALVAAKSVSGMVKAIMDVGQKTAGELKPFNIEEV
ncbi:MAG: histidine kinase N-terminal 7TM domain-containing protein, partial [Candidatus Omnitrophota bacterium]